LVYRVEEKARSSSAESEVEDTMGKLAIGGDDEKRD
jgi:hypothetical protein